MKSKKLVTCYLASGWFNEAEEVARKEILEALEKTEISYFSPKDEVLISNISDKSEQKYAFRKDIESINSCDFVVASTVGKDMGTLFEMGFSYANNVPLVIYFPAPKGTPCNLMLAQSAYAIAQSKDELIQILEKLKESNFDFSKKIEFDGNVE